MAAIERRQRTRRGPVHWRVRWRDAEGRQRSRTFETHADAKRYKLRLEGDVAAGTWIDPNNARIPLGEFVVEWRKSIVDLRPTSLARMESAVRNQILPEWGATALSGIANADVRAWAARLHASGYSASTVRKAVFTLRRILDAAVADRRLAINAADKVPLPVEEPGEQRFLTAEEVEVLADTIAPPLPCDGAGGRLRGAALR